MHTETRPHPGSARASGRVIAWMGGESKLKRSYRAWDKNSDGSVSFAEWIAMKNYTLTAEQRQRERRWFERAKANRDERVTESEWIAWKLNPGRE